MELLRLTDMPPCVQTCIQEPEKEDEYLKRLRKSANDLLGRHDDDDDRWVEDLFRAKLLSISLQMCPLYWSGSLQRISKFVCFPSPFSASALLFPAHCLVALLLSICSDDDWFDDEEETLQTPLDGIDPYIMLADTLAALQVHSPARHQAIIGGNDPGVQAALQGLLTLSVEKRQKLAQLQVAG